MGLSHARGADDHERVVLAPGLGGNSVRRLERNAVARPLHELFESPVRRGSGWWRGAIARALEYCFGLGHRIGIAKRRRAGELRRELHCLRPERLERSYVGLEGPDRLLRIAAELALEQRL